VRPPRSKDFDGLGRGHLAEVVWNILRRADPPLEPNAIAFNPSPYASSHFLIDVAVSTSGELLHLVMKDIQSPSPQARLARPNTPRIESREADVYTTMLPEITGPPRFFGAHRLKGHHWLLLERVRGRELTKVGEQRIWDMAARWLGHLHTSGATSPKSGVVRDEAYLDQALARARKGIEAAPGAYRLNRVTEGWARIVELLLTIPASVMHGDAFPANVLVGEANRVCFVDWELAGFGPGLIDLAALTAGKWSDVERLRMVASYAQGLTDSGTVNTTGLIEHLLVCRILLAVEMMGALRDWQPPSHQVWDWPRELGSLLDQFGL